MAKYIVAVSGGVDSVVLLDALVRKDAINERVVLGEPTARELIVAHFDHGIRPDSHEDAAFVKQLADTYGLDYVGRREELGKGASEELARQRRYKFLFDLAKKHNATIVTAHHADDVVETIAINCQRGTGWRGVAVLGRPGIWRPLLEVRKRDLLQYAKMQQLEWREDSTNEDLGYLRNRLRQRLRLASDESVAAFGVYRTRQLALRAQIDEEVALVMPPGPDYLRYLFITVPPITAVELLRAVFIRECHDGLTIVQRQQILQAIKVAKPGKTYEVSSDVRLRFTQRHFVVELAR